MIYHLDTIPVWEAMDKEAPCPFCALYERMEQQEVERSLGGSVMEPDTRIRVNETGICARHHQQLFGMQNRLGHALLTDSHSKELLKKLEKLEKQAENLPKRGLFSKRTEEDELAAALRTLSSGCVICEGIDSHMKRYLYTFVHLWKTDAAFVKKWAVSPSRRRPSGNGQSEPERGKIPSVRLLRAFGGTPRAGNRREGSGMVHPEIRLP